MIFTYKNKINFDFSLRFKNYAAVPHTIGTFFQNQKNTIVFNYISWNCKMKSSLTNCQAVLQLLKDFFSSHRNGFFTIYDNSFYCSLSVILYCLNFYNDSKPSSLLIRIEVYKILIILIRFAKLHKKNLNLIFKNISKFLVETSNDDTLYSIQAISLISNYYLSVKFFKLFSQYNLHILIKTNNLNIVLSLCNILINMSQYPKINSQYIHDLILIVTEIIAKYQNPIIFIKSLTILLNLSKNPLISFQDFLLKGIHDEKSQNRSISLFDFFQNRISSSKNSNSSYINNSNIIIFRIFRRLIDLNNISYFSCIVDAFQYINSQDPDLQYYSFKFIYHYLKSFNNVNTSSQLFINFLKILRNYNHQIISSIFYISAVEGALKIKTLGFLVISELFKIPSFFDDVIIFCDPIFIESLCLLFEIQNNYLLFDSISGILLSIIEFEKKKKSINWKDSPLTNFIIQAMSIDVLECITENTACFSNIQHLLFTLRLLNQ